MASAMPYCNCFNCHVGRRNRDRTCDFCLVRAALSQLSYPPDFQRCQKIFGMLSTLFHLVNDNGALFLHNLPPAPSPGDGVSILCRAPGACPPRTCGAGSTLCVFFSIVPALHACRSASSRCSHDPASPAPPAGRPPPRVNAWQMNGAAYAAKAAPKDRLVSLDAAAASRMLDASWQSLAW